MSDFKYARIQHWGATKEWWQEKDPVLLQNEMGIEADTGKFKFGDGVSKWSQLQYFTYSATEVDTKVGEVNTRVNEINTKVSGIDTRLSGIDTRLSGIDTRIGGVDTKVDTKLAKNGLTWYSTTDLQFKNSSNTVYTGWHTNNFYIKDWKDSSSSYQTYVTLYGFKNTYNKKLAEYRGDGISRNDKSLLKLPDAFYTDGFNGTIALKSEVDAKLNKNLNLENNGAQFYVKEIKSNTETGKYINLRGDLIEIVYPNPSTSLSTMKSWLHCAGFTVIEKTTSNASTEVQFLKDRIKYSHTAAGSSEADIKTLLLPWANIANNGETTIATLQEIASLQSDITSLGNRIDDVSIQPAALEITGDWYSAASDVENGWYKGIEFEIGHFYMFTGAGITLYDTSNNLIKDTSKPAVTVAEDAKGLMLILPNKPSADSGGLQYRCKAIILSDGYISSNITTKDFTLDYNAAKPPKVKIKASSGTSVWRI